MTAAIPALLAGCSQTDAPSDELEEVAGEVVAAVEGASPAPASQGTYAPRNECGALPGATDFLAELRQAIETRDAPALVALAAEDVKLDFGGGSGTAELRRRLDDDEDALWDDLAPLPALGCAANRQGGITVPWYFEQQVPLADPFGGFIVTGTGIPVYELPAQDARPIARLDWELVELVPTGPDYAGYRHVRLVPAPGAGGTARTGATGALDAGASGAGQGGTVSVRSDAATRGAPSLTGYVAEDQLRSLVDYRLIAASRNGRWRIIALVAGD